MRTRNLDRFGLEDSILDGARDVEGIEAMVDPPRAALEPEPAPELQLALRAEESDREREDAWRMEAVVRMLALAEWN
jgi:hypothetical protein